MTNRTTWTLLYDRDCPFCRWSAGVFLRWDRAGRIRALALQDPEAEALLPGMRPEERMASWHLVTPDGRVASAGAGAAPLLRLLPGGAPLAAVAEAAPGAVEAAYQWMSRNRGRLCRLIGRRCLRSADPAERGR